MPKSTVRKQFPTPRTLEQLLDRSPACIQDVDDTVAIQDIFARYTKEAAWEVWAPLSPNQQKDFLFYLFHACANETADFVFEATYARSARIRIAQRVYNDYKSWEAEIQQSLDEVNKIRQQSDRDVAEARKQIASLENSLRYANDEVKAQNWRIREQENKLDDWERYRAVRNWHDDLALRIARSLRMGNGREAAAGPYPVISQAEITSAQGAIVPALSVDAVYANLGPNGDAH